MVELDARTFHKRARALLATWKKDTSSDFKNVDFLLISSGKNDEEVLYSKHGALHQWLLGYEFPDTLMFISEDKIVFLLGKGRAKYIDTLKSDKVDRQVPIEVLAREKDGSNDQEVFGKLIELMKSTKNGKTMGVFAKDKVESKFIDSWKSTLSSSGTEFEQVDVSAGVAVAMASKDDDELRKVRIAAKLSSLLMKSFVADTVLSIIDDGKKVTHERIADNIEAVVQDPEKRKKVKYPSDIDFDVLEMAYTPIIQSGGQYDLKASASSDERPLQAGAILCSLGLRYNSYCSNVARTYLVNAQESQESNYRFLLKLHNHVIESIQEGMRHNDLKCRDVYNTALNYIKKNRPELEPHFPKSCGFAMGLEFRESGYLINAKTDRPLRNDMVINLSLGFQNIPLPDSKKTYALLICDTLRISSGSVDVLTDAPRALKEIAYELKDSDAEGDENADKNKSSNKKSSPAGKAKVKSEANESAPSPRVTKSRVLESKLRGQNRNELSRDAKRREHQRELHERNLKDGLERFGDGQKVTGPESSYKMKKYESYRRENQLPEEVAGLKIVIDRRNESIILPIYGLAVPFHISTLKNVTKSDEGRFIYLRFNFITPGQAGGKKDFAMPVDDPNASFVRSLTFRSEDRRFLDIFTAVNNLKKEMQKREEERRQMADLVEQDQLSEVRGRRPLRLQDIGMRPQLDTKKTRADLEIHMNGIRFIGTLKSDVKIDILFSNIRHLFFQPCDGEESVIIHVTLKHPIMIGKKKTKDVQFFRDVNEQAFDETTSRRRKFNYGDEDELMAEQEERRRRAMFNKEFKAFAEKIAEASENTVDVDIPYRELGFNGVPHRDLILLQPTTNCLVGLTDRPAFVVSLDEVEIVHLERVQHGLKNFDMVFVFKEFSRAPTFVKTVPTSQLEAVKEWLDSMDVPFFEGPISLNWSQIMKTINEDPGAFFREGGWSFLSLEGDEEDVSEDGSEFEMEEDDWEEESEEASSVVESDEDEDSEEYENSDDDEDDESGADWDDLEREAIEYDQKKRKGGEEEDDGGKSGGGKNKKMRR